MRIERPKGFGLHGEEGAVPSKQGPPTLADVAASAGVSIATVSKVVNGRADVGPGTRARVQSILQQHDYIGRRSEPVEHALRGGATVELVFHGQLTSYSVEVLKGVVEAATQAGATVAVSLRPREMGPGVKRSVDWVRDVTTSGRSAVIDVVDDLRQGDLAALSRARLPLVVIDPLRLPHRQVTSVGTTNFSGGLTATQHLISLGHRRIAYLGSNAAFAYNQARMHGYRAGLEAEGINVPTGYVRNVGSRFEDGLAGGGALFGLSKPPTAVFAVTDECAAGVMEAARARGLQVPKDLSVVGFDDTQITRLLSPPLTSVHQPLREMGVMALRTALRLAAGETIDSHHVELATELVVRSSTAPPAS
ncbi:MAG: LacI family transcriptional regulator [Propionibacteriaceae bacterium]|nr:LacI family transcriptional regulator [Propionibacteriaceae bacterium]